MTANPAMQLLVVDDDHNHREMLRALLEEWGYAVSYTHLTLPTILRV